MVTASHRNVPVSSGAHHNIVPVSSDRLLENIGLPNKVQRTSPAHNISDCEDNTNSWPHCVPPSSCDQRYPKRRRKDNKSNSYSDVLIYDSDNSTFEPNEYDSVDVYDEDIDSQKHTSKKRTLRSSKNINVSRYFNSIHFNKLLNCFNFVYLNTILFI